MRLDPIKRIVLVLACAVAITSCEEGTTTAPPTGALPIGTGPWYLNTANDSALSAVIATRLIGVSQEVTHLDSAYLEIGAGGTYEERIWLQIFVTGVLDRKETVIDYGTWTVVGNIYVFTSNVRDREFDVAPTAGGTIETLESMVFYQNPPVTNGDYRRTRP